MKGKQKTRKVVVLVLVTLLTLLGGTASVGSAAPTEQGDGVAVTITRTRIVWQPLIENGGIVLTISGPGANLEKEYDGNARITLRNINEAGNPRPDGVYTYEIQLLPVNNNDRQPNVDDEERGLVEVDGGEAQVYTGAFTISGGYFVTPAVEEGAGTDAAESRPGLDSAVTDVLHYDDVIITGSLCVGFDCQDGESFGFDTVILKEHNLRIYFNDTSYTASYPTNNWRITINDSTNGGASYFSVDDVDDGTSIFKIEAGAPSNSLYVEDYGRVGFGTSTPVVEAHIKDSDTPTLRLEQDSSGGWTAQTFDVAGNESNFFIRDATNGSKLPFRIQPGTPSSTMCLKSDGYVGLGTWSPAYPLEVETTGENAQIVAERTSGATAKLGALTNKTVFGSVTNHPARVIVNDSMVAEFETDGDLSINGYLHEGSDVNSKESFAPVVGKDVLENLEDVSINTWSFRASDDGARHMGPTAQDFYAAYGLGSDDKHISALDVGGVALAAIKELDKIVEGKDARIKALEEQNAVIQTQNSKLEERVSALEKAVGSGAAQVPSLLTFLPWLLVGVLLGTGVPAVIRLRKQRT